MATRVSEAVWEGSLKEGKGKMKMPGFEGPYTWSSRFEEAKGSNPEELISAALAGCFSMALSGDLTKAGFTVKQISTKVEVTISLVDGKHRITDIHMDSDVSATGGDTGKFAQIAEAARTGCPVGAALASIPIRLHAHLV